MSYGRHHHPNSRGCVSGRRLLECIAWTVATTLCIVSSSASVVQASDRAPTEPYGTPSEIQQCVAHMEASLQGRSILGSRDTAAYIQDLGHLDNMGLTEYDVMVGRCRNKFFHRYILLERRRR